MEGLSEGEDGGWGGGLDQLSSLLDAGFEGSDGEPENNENGHENEEEDPDAALAEYEELRMGQVCGCRLVGFGCVSQALGVGFQTR